VDVLTLSKQREYGGVKVLIDRLGLSVLVRELADTVTGFSLDLRRVVTGGAIRKKICIRLTQAGWRANEDAHVEWTKCQSVNGTRLSIGVQLRVSGPADLAVADICRLRDAWTDADIDVGVLVVPDDELGHYLTDRGPRFSDAIRQVRAARAEDFRCSSSASAMTAPSSRWQSSSRSRENSSITRADSIRRLELESALDRSESFDMPGDFVTAFVD
jgi:hypothetical protein